MKNALLILLTGCVTAFCQSPSSQKVKWYPFDQGIADASAQGKFILIEFYADWCTYCRLFENTTLRYPPVVKEISENFISIRVNTEGTVPFTWAGKSIMPGDFSKAMGVYGLPTLVFLNSRQDILGKFENMPDEKTMMNILQYISSGAREKNITWSAFLEKQPQ